MPSAFSHAIAAIAISQPLPLQRKWKLFTLGVVCAILPDADVLAFKLGIPYEHWLGHRGISHSAFFSFALALLVTTIFYTKHSWFGKTFNLLVLYFFLCTFSHAIMDAMTNGGLGVAFFAPFDNSRYFLPWQVIEVSPVSVSAFFSEWGWRVIKSELLWVWVPSLSIIVVSVLYRAISRSK